MSFCHPILSVHYLQQHIMNYTQWEAQQMQSDLENNNRMSAQAQPKPDPDPGQAETYSQCPSLCPMLNLRAKVSPAGQLHGQSSRFVTHVIMVAGSGSGASSSKMDSSLIVVAWHSHLRFALSLHALIIVIICSRGKQQGQQQQQVPAGAFRIGQCGGKIACRHAMSNGCSLSARGRSGAEGGEGHCILLCTQCSCIFIKSTRFCCAV